MQLTHGGLLGEGVGWNWSRFTVNNFNMFNTTPTENGGMLSALGKKDLLSTAVLTSAQNHQILKLIK